MLSFVELTPRNMKRPILINPDHVVSLSAIESSDSKTDGFTDTEVSFSNGSAIKLKGTPTEVSMLLRYPPTTITLPPATRVWGSFGHDAPVVDTTSKLSIPAGVTLSFDERNEILNEPAPVAEVDGKIKKRKKKAEVQPSNDAPSE